MAGVAPCSSRSSPRLSPGVATEEVANVDEKESTPFRVDSLCENMKECYVSFCDGDTGEISEGSVPPTATVPIGGGLSLHQRHVTADPRVAIVPGMLVSVLKGCANASLASFLAQSFPGVHMVRVKDVRGTVECSFVASRDEGTDEASPMSTVPIGDRLSLRPRHAVTDSLVALSSPVVEDGADMSPAVSAMLFPGACTGTVEAEGVANPSTTMIGVLRCPIVGGRPDASSFAGAMLPPGAYMVKAKGVYASVGEYVSDTSRSRDGRAGETSPTIAVPIGGGLLLCREAVADPSVATTEGLPVVLSGGHNEHASSFSTLLCGESVLLIGDRDGHMPSLASATEEMFVEIIREIKEKKGEVVRSFLADRSVDIDGRDGEGCVPLMIAAGFAGRPDPVTSPRERGTGATPVGGEATGETILAIMNGADPPEVVSSLSRELSRAPLCGRRVDDPDEGEAVSREVEILQSDNLEVRLPDLLSGLLSGTDARGVTATK
ncbi:MAG: hypothetical protein OXF02_07110 [Simkaniaceae bacterium]|nr:hypothetical protein [Simkaniaceae bacterium]